MSRTLLTLGFALGGLSALSAQDHPSPLSKDREIALEGGTSFDLATVDPASGRLYVAHSPKIDVIDLKKGERVGQVDGVDGAHGVTVVSELKHGFAAAGRKNRLVVFDLETLKITKEVETGQSPDVVLYVSSTKEVWTFNGRSKNVTCVDASTLEVKATIELDGKPELAVEHAEPALVYVNFEDQSSIGAIDAKKHQVVATHPVAPGEGPTGLAFDSKNGLFFVGCGNKKLVVIDSATWKAVTSFDIGEHCDGVVFDPETGNAFASCRGMTNAVHVKDAKTIEALAPLETKGGKTCALDSKTHRLYVVSGPGRGEKGTVTILEFKP